MSKRNKKAAASEPDKPPEGALKQVFLGWYGVVGMTLGYVSPVKLPWADSYAKDYWRHALGSLLIVLALLGGLVGLALHVLDVNDFKQQIVDYVKTHQQRDLALEGDIHLNFFPTLGIDTGKLVLSQRNSGRKFASVNNARLYVAWWPLLLKEVRVERVVLDGLHANLVRYADGSANFEDLLQPAGWMGEVQFEVDKLRIIDSSLNYHDEGSDRAWLVHELNLETGRLAAGAAGPVQASLRLQSIQAPLDLHLHLSAHLLVQQTLRQLELTDLDATAQGDALGLNDLALELHGSLMLQQGLNRFTLEKFNGMGRGKRDGRAMEARWSGAKLQRDGDVWRGVAVTAGGSVQVDKSLHSISLELPEVAADAQALHCENLQLALDLFPGELAVQGKFSSPAAYTWATRTLQLMAIKGGWSAAHPLLAGKLNADSSGALLLNGATQELRLNLKTQIDETELSTNVQAQGLAAPVWAIDATANVLDLDRYLASDWLAQLRSSVQATDFDALKTLNLKARLHSDELRLARMKISQLAAELHAGQGVLDVGPLQARLYGGSLQGEGSLSAGEAPQLAWRQRLEGVQLDALLADGLRGEARLSGKGNVLVDLRAQGATLEALRQSLSGDANVALVRGSVSGANLAAALAAGRDQMGLPEAARSVGLHAGESTPFSELKAHINFGGGQARSPDLMLKSPELNLKGEASMALESGELQARLQATVAPGLKRGNVGDLADMGGLTVPLQISGAGPEAALHLDLAGASGAPLARLARANQARVAAQTARPTPPAPTASLAASAAQAASVADAAPKATAK